MLVFEALSYKPGSRGFETLTEMSIRSRKIMFLGSRERPVGKADNLITIGVLTV
jgi:hypothetical protein